MIYCRFSSTWTMKPKLQSHIFVPEHSNQDVIKISQNYFAFHCLHAHPKSLVSAPSVLNTLPQPLITHPAEASITWLPNYKYDWVHFITVIANGFLLLLFLRWKLAQSAGNRKRYSSNLVNFLCHLKEFFTIIIQYVKIKWQIHILDYVLIAK